VRVVSAAGDAGLRARVLQGVEVLERERPAVPLFTAVAQRTHGLLERDADGLVAAARALHSWRPLLYAGAAEDAGAEFARRARNADALVQLKPHSTPTCTTKRSPMRAGWAASCAGSVCNVVSSASRGQRRAGTASPTPRSRSST